MEPSRMAGVEPVLIATDELDDGASPTKMEQFRAEVREFNRAEQAEKAKKRAQRKRAKAGRKNNRKR